MNALAAEMRQLSETLTRLSLVLTETGQQVKRDLNGASETLESLRERLGKSDLASAIDAALDDLEYRRIRLVGSVGGMVMTLGTVRGDLEHCARSLDQGEVTRQTLARLSGPQA